MQSVAELRLGGARGKIDAWLLAAAERSYVDTKDCPELCGLHRRQMFWNRTRRSDSSTRRLWLIAFDEGEHKGAAHGPNRDGDCVELVYLGLGTRLRGRGLGRRLWR